MNNEEIKDVQTADTDSTDKRSKRNDAVISNEKEQLEAIVDVESCIEAILFAAGYPVKYSTLAELFSITVKDVKKIVSHMEEYFNSADNRRGLELLMFPDTCQLCTREKFLPYIREALGIKRGGNLSASSLEVLAVVAYNQPVTRAFIDKIRGVDSAYAVTTLTEKELIAPCGRLDAPGKPVLYATTDKFLRVFGLSSLHELPDEEQMQNAFMALSDEGIQQSMELDVKPTEETVI